MSSSSSGYRRRYGHYGSNHYQKKGILGGLFNMFSSMSGSHKHGNPYDNGYQYNNMNMPNHTNMPNQPAAASHALTCSKCNSQIPAGSKFCLQCGEKVSDGLFCMNCGEKLPSNAKFCLKCGSKVNG